MGDDGPGVPTEFQDEGFDHGFPTKETGSGYGRSIVRPIANAHGWDARATAGVAGGARFGFTGIQFLDWADEAVVAASVPGVRLVEWSSPVARASRSFVEVRLRSAFPVDDEPEPVERAIDGQFEGASGHEQ